jgi:hypothetical protein
MRVLVSDTSILIDLERGGLLETAFGLPWEFAVTDLLYKRELRDHHGPALQRLGLRIEALDENGVRLALAYQTRVPALSLPDTFAITLAKVSGWALLIGDSELRQLAAVEDVEHHGVLWILDQLLEHGKVKAGMLHGALRIISAHPRCRLPERDVREHLDCYLRFTRNPEG